MNYSKNKVLDFFIMNDQPFTCPYCGSRCDIIADFFHTAAQFCIQQCLYPSCIFICIEVEE